MNALVKQFSKLLFRGGSGMPISLQTHCENWAAQAIKKGTGVGPCAALVEKIMLDAMYDAPTNGDITSVTVTRPAVLGETGSVIRRKDLTGAGRFSP